MGALLWLGYPFATFPLAHGMDYIPVLETMLICIMLPSSFLFFRFTRALFQTRGIVSRRLVDVANPVEGPEGLELALGLALGFAINGAHIFSARSGPLPPQIYHYAWTLWLLGGCYHVWRRARDVENIAI